jgi:hypothetical protein
MLFVESLRPGRARAVPSFGLALKNPIQVDRVLDEGKFLFRKSGAQPSPGFLKKNIDDYFQLLTKRPKASAYINLLQGEIVYKGILAQALHDLPSI